MSRFCWNLYGRLCRIIGVERAKESCWFVIRLRVKWINKASQYPIEETWEILQDPPLPFPKKYRNLTTKYGCRWKKGLKHQIVMFHSHPFISVVNMTYSIECYKPYGLYISCTLCCTITHGKICYFICKHTMFQIKEYGKRVCTYRQWDGTNLCFIYLTDDPKLSNSTVKKHLNSGLIDQ